MVEPYKGWKEALISFKVICFEVLVSQHVSQGKPWMGSQSRKPGVCEEHQSSLASFSDGAELDGLVRPVA